MMNQLMGVDSQDREGFALGPQVDPTTKGIWVMGGERQRLADGTEAAVLYVVCFSLSLLAFSLSLSPSPSFSFFSMFSLPLSRSFSLQQRKDLLSYLLPPLSPPSLSL